MENISKKDNLTELITYVFVGGSAFVVEYGVFYVINDHSGSLFKLNLFAAQTISFCCGLLVSFFGNKLITFSHTRDRSKKSANQFAQYASLAVINLLLTNVLIYLLVSGASIPALFAKVMVMALIVSWNFVIFKKIIFKAKV